MIVPGPACGAAAVQPAVCSPIGVVLDTVVTVPAQLGGTDNLPTMVAPPKPAVIGIAPIPAMPDGPTAGPVVPARSAAPESPVRPPAASEGAVTALRRPPPAIPNKSDSAEANFPASSSPMVVPPPDGPNRLLPLRKL